MSKSILESKYIILPTENLRALYTDDISNVRKEGYDDKIFFEISIFARNRVENPKLQHIGLSYTPMDAIIEELDHHIGMDFMMEHLYPDEQEKLISSIQRISLAHYLHLNELFSRTLRHLDDIGVDVYPEEWLGEDLVISFVRR